MTTFAERLAVLPGRPKLPIQHETNLEPYRTNKILWHIMDDCDALEARLRLAVELLERSLDAEHQSWVKGCPECMTTRDDTRALVGKVKGELGA